MNKNLGGRGKTNPYSTVVKRIPDILEPNVDRLIEQLQAQIKVSGMVGYVQATVLDNRENDQYSFLMPTRLELIEIAKEILKHKKSAAKSMSKLLQVICKDDSIEL